MENQDSPYEGALKDAAQAVSKIMDDLDTVHDGIQIHVNGFGMWVVKYKTRDGSTYYAFGQNLLLALQNLKNNPNKDDA